MPTYDYECDACEHRFELFQRITEDPQQKCPSCGKKKLRRLIGTGAAIVFKGSGFYQTDYRSDSYRKAAEADKKSAEGGKSETKTESSSSSDTKPAPSSNDKSPKEASKPASKRKGKRS